mmetsp:Transcript_14526/g.18970  ORF Transcript_14526/g.18970 Transcript_14526/m.18970 type:complete len:208 (-) Transcript_14526:866-1489(-)
MESPGGGLAGEGAVAGLSLGAECETLLVLLLVTVASILAASVLSPNGVPKPKSMPSPSASAVSQRPMFKTLGGARGGSGFVSIGARGGLGSGIEGATGGLGGSTTGAPIGCVRMGELATGEAGVSSSDCVVAAPQTLVVSMLGRGATGSSSTTTGGSVGVSRTSCVDVTAGSSSGSCSGRGAGAMTGGAGELCLMCATGAGGFGFSA